MPGAFAVFDKSKIDKRFSLEIFEARFLRESPSGLIALSSFVQTVLRELISSNSQMRTDDSALVASGLPERERILRSLQRLRMIRAVLTLAQKQQCFGTTSDVIVFLS